MKFILALSLLSIFTSAAIISNPEEQKVQVKDDEVAVESEPLTNNVTGAAEHAQTEEPEFDSLRKLLAGLGKGTAEKESNGSSNPFSKLFSEDFFNSLKIDLDGKVDENILNSLGDAESLKENFNPQKMEEMINDSPFKGLFDEIKKGFNDNDEESLHESFADIFGDFFGMSKEDYKSYLAKLAEEGNWNFEL